MLRWFNNKYKNVPKDWKKNRTIPDTALRIYFILVMKHLNFPISKDVVKYLCTKYLTIWCKKYVERDFYNTKWWRLNEVSIFRNVMTKRTNVIDYNKNTNTLLFDICKTFLNQGQKIFFCYQTEYEEEKDYPIYLNLSHNMGYQVQKSWKVARDLHNFHNEKIRWGLYKDYGKDQYGRNKCEQHTFAIVYGTNLKQNVRLFKKIKNNTRCCGLLIVNIPE